MKRREFLRTLTILPLLSGGVAAPFHPAGAVERPTKAVTLRRVRPSDPTWPSAASWNRLNQDVGSSLIKVKPLFASCASAPKGAECLEELRNAHNPFFLGDQPAGTQVSGWLDAWAPAASVYAVAARNTADVAAAVTFARENNLRLVVKGGGHSYQGTSNAPDSLLVWTRAMNAVTLHDAFVGDGCYAFNFCRRGLAPATALAIR